MNKKGFTLIELLVVVLIIGILSGIALPQYMKAINRSRATEAWQAGKTLLDGEHMYFLENREYTSDTTQLRIQPNALKNFTIAEVSTNTSAPWYVRLNGVNAMADFQFTFILQADGTRQVACSHTQLAECRNVLPCGVDSMTDIASVPGTSAAGKACTL